MSRATSNAQKPQHGFLRGVSLIRRQGSYGGVTVAVVSALVDSSTITPTLLRASWICTRQTLMFAGLAGPFHCKKSKTGYSETTRMAATLTWAPPILRF